MIYAWFFVSSICCFFSQVPQIPGLPLMTRSYNEPWQGPDNEPRTRSCLPIFRISKYFCKFQFFSALLSDVMSMSMKKAIPSPTFSDIFHSFVHFRRKSIDCRKQKRDGGGGGGKNMQTTNIFHLTPFTGDPQGRYNVRVIPTLAMQVHYFMA